MVTLLTVVVGTAYAQQAATTTTAAESTAAQQSDSKGSDDNKEETAAAAEAAQSALSTRTTTAPATHKGALVRSDSVLDGDGERGALTPAAATAAATAAAADDADASFAAPMSFVYDDDDDDDVDVATRTASSSSSSTSHTHPRHHYPHHRRRHHDHRSRANALSRHARAALYEQVLHALYVEGNLSLAVTHMIEGAAAGHGRLHWLLAVLHSAGVGVALDEARARFHLLQAARHAVPEAHAALAQRHAHGLGGVPVSCPRAVQHMRVAAEAVVRADADRGLWLPSTPSLPPSPLYAEENNNSSSSSSSSSGSNRHYSSGSLRGSHADRVRQRQQQQRRYAEQQVHLNVYHADLGNAEAMLSLGYFHLRGHHGVPRSWHAALRHLRRAAEAGDVRAWGMLGKLYATGDATALPPVLRNVSAAASLLRRGEAANDAGALNAMGYLHTRGYLYKRAVRPSVVQLHADTQTVMTASMMHNSNNSSSNSSSSSEPTVVLPHATTAGTTAVVESSEYDDATAADYYRRSIQKTETATALYNMAELLLRGRGVPANVTAARRLYELAAARQHVYALLRLAQLRERELHLDADYTEEKPLAAHTGGSGGSGGGGDGHGSYNNGSSSSSSSSSTGRPPHIPASPCEQVLSMYAMVVNFGRWFDRHSPSSQLLTADWLDELYVSDGDGDEVTLTDTTRTTGATANATATGATSTRTRLQLPSALLRTHAREVRAMVLLAARRARFASAYTHHDDGSDSDSDSDSDSSSSSSRLGRAMSRAVRLVGRGREAKRMRRHVYSALVGRLLPPTRLVSTLRTLTQRMAYAKRQLRTAMADVSWWLRQQLRRGRHRRIDNGNASAAATTTTAASLFAQQQQQQLQVLRDLPWSSSPLQQQQQSSSSSVRARTPPLVWFIETLSWSMMGNEEATWHAIEALEELLDVPREAEAVAPLPAPAAASSSSSAATRTATTTAAASATTRTTSQATAASHARVDEAAVMREDSLPGFVPRTRHSDASNSGGADGSDAASSSSSSLPSPMTAQLNAHTIYLLWRVAPVLPAHMARPQREEEEEQLQRYHPAAPRALPSTQHTYMDDTPRLLTQEEARRRLRLQLLQSFPLRHDGDAQLRVGDAYYHGELLTLGVDTGKALAAYMLAAENKNAYACYKVAVMHQLGIGTHLVTDDNDNNSTTTKTPMATRDAHGSSSSTTTTTGGAARVGALPQHQPRLRDVLRDLLHHNSPVTRQDMAVAAQYYALAAQHDERARVLVRGALLSLNLQWWYMYFSALPHGLCRALSWSMPYTNVRNVTTVVAQPLAPANNNSSSGGQKTVSRTPSSSSSRTAAAHTRADAHGDRARPTSSSSSSTRTTRAAAVAALRRRLRTAWQRSRDAVAALSYAAVERVVLVACASVLFSALLLRHYAT